MCPSAYMYASICVCVCAMYALCLQRRQRDKDQVWFLRIHPTSIFLFFGGAAGSPTDLGLTHSGRLASQQTSGILMALSPSTMPYYIKPELWRSNSGLTPVRQTSCQLHCAHSSFIFKVISNLLKYSIFCQLSFFSNWGRSMLNYLLMPKTP